MHQRKGAARAASRQRQPQLGARRRGLKLQQGIAVLAQLAAAQRLRRLPGQARCRSPLRRSPFQQAGMLPLQAAEQVVGG
jgi:hypothetical protein